MTRNLALQRTQPAAALFVLSSAVSVGQAAAPGRSATSFINESLETNGSLPGRQSIVADMHYGTGKGLGGQ